MNVDPNIINVEHIKKVKKDLEDHLEGKKQEDLGRGIFKAFTELYKSQVSAKKFPDLKEEVTNAVAKEEVKTLDAEILKDASDDIKIAAIKEDVELERAGIKTMCQASEIYMPRTYKFLEAYTTSEFKRIMLIHKHLGLWLEFPTIGELGRSDSATKKYFRTYLRLLEDRGTEQDKHFHYEPEEFLFLDKEEDNKIPHQLQRVLDEDEKTERYNERISGLSTLKIEVSDGIKWETIT